MKFYLFYEDDILQEILNISEIELKDKDLYKKIMNKNFNVWNDYVFTQTPEFLKNKVGLMSYYNKII